MTYRLMLMEVTEDAGSAYNFARKQTPESPSPAKPEQKRKLKTVVITYRST